MRFVNEEISSKDMDKYHIQEINESISSANTDWTVDHDRKIYLRVFSRNREEMQQKAITFYWKDQLLWFNLFRTGGGVFGGEGYATWSLHKDEKLPLPPALEEYRDEITADLKEALIAYKDGGFYSTVASHTAKFLF